MMEINRLVLPWQEPKYRILYIKSFCMSAFIFIFFQIINLNNRFSQEGESARRRGAFLLSSIIRYDT